ncbi:MAG: hypothetical protein LBJ03_03285 [Holosporales bacterium]|nr:hypothetical protein [Holosporales bacterium]
MNKQMKIVVSIREESLCSFRVLKNLSHLIKAATATTYAASFTVGRRQLEKSSHQIKLAMVKSAKDPETANITFCSLNHVSFPLHSREKYTARHTVAK